MHITQIMDGVHLHVRTCRCAHFPYLGNGWTNCAEIWCVVRDTLASRFAKVKGGVNLHVRAADLHAAHVQMCPLFCISESAERIALQFSVSLESR